MTVSQVPTRARGIRVASQVSNRRGGILRNLSFSAVMLSTALIQLFSMSACSSAKPPKPERDEHTSKLIRMVRQDCGSCHGMQLTGGLGPALTAQALADKPLDSLTATIYHGRPGTPMPGWKGMINEADARWIAEHLQQGFPHE